MDDTRVGRCEGTDSEEGDLDMKDAGSSVGVVSVLGRVARLLKLELVVAGSRRLDVSVVVRLIELRGVISS
jgi:hypothetical protein